MAIATRAVPVRVFPLSRRCIMPTDSRILPPSPVSLAHGSPLVTLQSDANWTMPKPRAERGALRGFGYLPNGRRGANFRDLGAVRFRALPSEDLRHTLPQHRGVGGRRLRQDGARQPRDAGVLPHAGEGLQGMRHVLRSMTARTLPLARWLMGPISANAGSSPSNQVSCHQEFDTESCQDR